ncbi:heterocyst frequency control protein PatD [Crocosphaera sp.]|uniref:heterocyst frequency control protein PatD n=1 Tax=Crocosphaera sp. TaxID=2729996 RepID=UPI0026110673|nr:heterocyst frequency control protein PatD [Crocosphaera sp.]MDJ0582448.1 heterocyst frequency control protein PatD [Crocosphaera sp.]
MLLKFYHQSYQELLANLVKLQKLVIAENTDRNEIKITYEQVQTIFEQQILSVGLDELDCNAIPLLRSAQTEIYKNLRLLGTELLFLTSSRRKETSKKRLEKVQGKVRELIGYSQAIIDQLQQ